MTTEIVSLVECLSGRTSRIQMKRIESDITEPKPVRDRFKDIFLLSRKLHIVLANSVIGVGG